jgi:hypothetical protein
MGVNIPWVGGRYTMGRGGENTMGGEGIQYILIIMGRGVIKFQNFQKSSKFQKIYRIKK